MKILYLTDQIYLHGGAEKILSLKINHLSSLSDFQIHLITTEQRNNPFVYPISDNIKWFDLGINYNRNISYFHPINFYKSITHFFKLKKSIDRVNPDIIVSISQSPEQYFLPFIRKNIPKIKEFHSSGITINKPVNILGKLKHRLFKLYKKYDTLVVLNDDEREYYPFDNLEIIPNFISTKKRKGVITKKNIILSAGRIARVKQFDHLIKIWALLYKKYPKWEVHIYGEGDELLSKELRVMIDKMEMKNIFLKGATSSLNKKMQEASIYALTSATECFPMVLLESLSNGLPIISYDCPHGPANIISDRKDGILVEHNSIDIFATNLSKLITDTESRATMENNALKNINRFREDIVMKKWLDLFKQLSS